MNKVLLTLALVSVTAALAASSAGAGGQAGYTCPPGFNLGAKNLADYLLLPRTHAAIVDGFATEDEIVASFHDADRNGDGYLCVQLSEGKQKYGPYSVYYYNVTDDNASVPG
jgi:hypothetical protein